MPKESTKATITTFAGTPLVRVVDGSNSRNISPANLVAESGAQTALDGRYLSLLSQQTEIASRQTLDDGSTPSSWSVTAGAATVASADGVLGVTTTSQSATTIRRHINWALSAGQAFRLRIRRDANLSALTVQIVTGDYLVASRTWTANLPIIIPNGQWFDIVLPMNGFSEPSGGVLSDFANVREIRLTVTPATSTNTTFEVDNIQVVGVAADPLVCFQFDDGFLSTYTEAFPVLAANGYVGQIAVSHDDVGDAGYCSQAQLEEMYDAGWAMSGHDDTAISGTESTARLAFATSRSYLINSGFVRGSRFYVWPGGSRDATRYGWGRDYFRIFRGTSSMVRYVTKYNVDPYDVPIRYVASQPTVASLKADIDSAIKYGNSIIFAFHDLVESPSAAEDYSISGFTELVEYAAAQGIASATFDDLFPA